MGGSRQRDDEGGEASEMHERVSDKREVTPEHEKQRVLNRIAEQRARILRIDAQIDPRGRLSSKSR